MKLRIAFCGASGTGKTTLAKWVSDQYHIPMNPIGSRIVAKEMGFESPYDVDKAGKREEFQRRLQAKKIAWEMENDIFVTDRTTLDDFSYTALHDVRAVDEVFIGKAFAHMNRYTHVFYCPTDSFCDPGDDPQRIKDMAYHRVFDMMMLGCLTNWQHSSGTFGYYVLDQSDLTERKKGIANVVSSLREEVFQ